MGGEITFVSSNTHKADEMLALGRKYGVTVKHVLGEKMEIQSMDTRDVARTAAILLFNSVKKPLFVDDSGLFVKALGGFPGALAHFVSKELVLKMLEGSADRRAYFTTTICYVDSSTVRTFDGFVNGGIADAYKGEREFGFDPVFVPDGEDKTFAEISVERKNAYSHRAMAFEKFANWLESERGKKQS